MILILKKSNTRKSSGPIVKSSPHGQCGKTRSGGTGVIIRPTTNLQKPRLTIERQRCLVIFANLEEYFLSTAQDGIMACCVH